MKVYSVDSITEADYGCEETCREEPVALLKLKPLGDFSGEEIYRYEEIPESILAKQGITEGKKVSFAPDGSIRKYVRVVAAVIYDPLHHAGKIFSTARGYGEYKGWWEFPGGKIEAGETPQEALVREIREELTATIKVGELIQTVEYDYPTFHLSMDCFWAEVVAGHLELKEAEDARWLREEDLDEVQWLPADRLLIDTMLKDNMFYSRVGRSSNKTIEYYNKNAAMYVDSTVNVDFAVVQDRFLGFLAKDAYILDFGCGSGRDTKYFLEKGYRVDAIDGSREFCVIASKNTGIEVKQCLFEEFTADKKYDGIWACSSILHLSKEKLRNVIPAMLRALKDGGYIYTSFKYGNYEGERHGRYFTDFTENSFCEFLNTIGGMKLVDLWVAGDVRPGRSEEKWLNLILQKS